MPISQITANSIASNTITDTNIGAIANTKITGLVTASQIANVANTQVTGTITIAQGGTGTTSTTFTNLATNVTGTLPIANGGTGTTSTTFTNLATNVTGTLPTTNGGTGLTAIGTANQVLKVNSGGTALEYGNVTIPTLISAFSNDSGYANGSGGSTTTTQSFGDGTNASASQNGNFVQFAFGEQAGVRLTKSGTDNYVLGGVNCNCNCNC